jgi:hypothetical protein
LAKSQYNLEKTSGRMEASLLPGTSGYITFAILKSQRLGAGVLDPALAELNNIVGDTVDGPIVLDADSDDLSGKLELYMQTLIHEFLELETCLVSRIIIQRAVKLALESQVTTPNFLVAAKMD